MTDQELLVRAVLVLVPVVAAWVVIVVDVVRRPGLSRRRRAGWLVAVTLVPLAMLVWLLTRPVALTARVRARIVPPDDPRARLVDLVEAHDRGDVDAATFSRDLAALLAPHDRG